MRVVLTGATGMVGGGVLQACLEDEGIEAVLSAEATLRRVRLFPIVEVAHGHEGPCITLKREGQ